MNTQQIDLLSQAMNTTVFDELWWNYTSVQIEALVAELSNCTTWSEMVEVLAKHQEQLIDSF